MVFQQGAPLVLWGFAPANAAVRVTFANLTGGGAADATGFWRVTLPPLGASGPHTVQVLVVGSPATNATLTDVHVGTVLFCSGQSNTSGATTPLSFCFNSTASEAEAASFPLVRLFTVGEQEQSGDLPPLQQLGFTPYIPWSPAPAAAPKFSCMCWMTAKALAQALGPAHAIGVIEAAWSGTCIQGWLPAAALASCGANPPPSQGGRGNSSLYNQLVAPFTAGGAGGMTVAGILWGQGESNAIFFRPGYYACGLGALLSSWRSAFQNPTAWLGVMQLAPWSGFSTTPEAASTVREEQALVVLADAHATLATEIDLGDATSPLSDIHNRPKQALGARLAAGALLHLFSQGALEDSQGPSYSSAVNGGGPANTLSATITLAPLAAYAAPGSLLLDYNRSSWPGVLPSSQCPGAAGFDCAGFEVQDAAGVWHAATATLSADASALVLVGVGAPGGPVNATRYGQGVWPLASLFAARGAGLPAYPWAARAVLA